ncbi:MAG TPA: TetR/AcrR family transcriptional regulator [Solirubrobacteraceae bacterium]|jgi:AcrR family transcriptional regulator|nr:TetR/AcrR family transcriptional regulator [Solirubrobacteraceae bacterium]
MTRDREILRTAERLFYERGYGAVPVDLIGETMGVTGPAIYSHFKGKADILAALYDEAMDRMLTLAGPVREDPVEELENLVRAHAQFVLERRELLTVYTREDRALPKDARRRFRRRQREYVDRWIDALEQLHPDRQREELSTIAHAVIGMLMAATGWPQRLLRRPGSSALLAELALSTLDTHNARSLS